MARTYKGKASNKINICIGELDNGHRFGYAVTKHGIVGFTLVEYRDECYLVTRFVHSGAHYLSRFSGKEIAKIVPFEEGAAFKKRLLQFIQKWVSGVLVAKDAPA